MNAKDQLNKQETESLLGSSAVASQQPYTVVEQEINQNVKEISSWTKISK